MIHVTDYDKLCSLPYTEMMRLVLSDRMFTESDILNVTLDGFRDYDEKTGYFNEKKGYFDSWTIRYKTPDGKIKDLLIDMKSKIRRISDVHISEKDYPDEKE